MQNLRLEAVDWSTSPPLLHLSDGTTEPLDADTLSYRPGGRLYCRVKDRKFRARFKRHPYHDLIDRLEEEDGEVYLRLPDGRAHLGPFEEE